jgi:hypothetical protein
MKLVIKLDYNVASEKAALDIEREILDYVNKGLLSISAKLYTLKSAD